jgi:DNA-binding NtrC family response regulator
LSAILEDAGYGVDVVADGQKALDKLVAERYGVVLADLKMPRLDGLTLLRELQQREIPTECIIITGQATVDSAVQAMQQGAYDYIEKPLNAEKLNRLKALIPKALDKYQVQQKNRELASKLEGLTHYGELTGQSESMRSVYQVIEAVAPSSASVLILGESGTGKELVARALHAKSDRAKGPFFALNCAALPKEILENELFGHEKGAFTGSINEKPGAFEMSSGGTIFLDEMAEMAPDIQVKLLRAIETKQVRRLGGKKEINVDIRILVEIDLPPLRERSQDIQLLANEFLGRFAQQNGKTITGFDDAAWAWLMSYHWPGNVRELKNAVERAVIMSRSATIGTEDIVPRHLRGGEMPTALTIPVGATAAEARQQLVLRTFASTSGDAARTGKVLGLAEKEVRAELLALLQGAPSAGTAKTSNGSTPAAPAARAARRSEPAAAPARATAKKSTAKRGR